MKPRYTLVVIVSGILVLAAACSIWKKDDPDKDIRAFLTDFEKSLTGTDEAILKQFEARQSKEAILSAIHVLQNKELDHLHCSANFQAASIIHDPAGIKIEIPVALKTENLADTLSRDSKIILWIEPDHGHLVISKLEGESFYNDYLSIKYEVNTALNAALELADRKVYFDAAHALQQKYDTIIWYVHYDAKTFYYAVNGQWKNYFIGNEEKPSGYKMGLVNESGDVIVPLDYDLVGTPGMVEANIIEVKKDGKVGFYSTDGKQLVAPDYDWIIPYKEDDTYALVKQDTTYGWLDNGYAYHAGFPPGEAARYIKNYEFLPSQITLSNDEQSMAEIPNSEYMGYGILMPPAYWTTTGVFDEILPGFTKGENLYMGYREYITADHSFVETVAGNISALITSIKERYLEGREEFYQHNQVSFVNQNGQTLATDDLYSIGELTFKKLEDNVLEAKVVESSESSSGWDEPGDGQEWNLPIYKYYQMDENSITPLTSNRSFIQTEYTKLDSAYLTGNFMYYNPETQSTETRTFLSDMTLTEMRNEILASYGYIFKNEEVAKEYSYRDWYKPRHENYSDFADQLTDIDKHNLAFLERIIGSLDTSPA